MGFGQVSGILGTPYPKPKTLNPLGPVYGMD